MSEVWQTCARCGARLQRSTWQRRQFVCLQCGFHGRVAARARLLKLLDPDSFQEIDAALGPGDPMDWHAEGESYPQMIATARASATAAESFVGGGGRIDGRQLWIGAFEFRFLGGSLGSVAGEKVARLLERARADRVPAVIFTASGGARMQEGMLSLMQMAKIATVVAALNEARVPLITVICDPTTGGVAASLAFMGDVVLAEPGALVGFAGPRVILQTIGEEIPAGVQTTDRLCADGFIDEIVSRADLRRRISDWLRALTGA